ncbi:MAG: transposase [Undibacterium sp.]|nr:transposase [Undibacterium sp.]MDO8653929.1 transposase [Undibacterium sp.]
MDEHVSAFKRFRREKAIAKKEAKRLIDEIIATRVIRFRLKDRHVSELRLWSGEVNFLWNYCNDLGDKVYQREHRFLHKFEYAQYTKGAGQAGLHLHSQTIQAVSEEFATRRQQFGKVKLQWRKSKGVRRSLGWIPIKASALTYRAGQLWVSGMEYQTTSTFDHHLGVPEQRLEGKKKPLSLWDSHGLATLLKENPNALGTSTISEDSRGRWYINITVKVPKKPKMNPADPSAPISGIGIDLGLKDLASMSDGKKADIQHFYRDAEAKLAIAQRANKKDRVKAIHAQIANRRKDYHHKLSTDLVSRYCAIFVGNVSASGLAKTTMAKSVLDAGWSMLRTMLLYKCADAGRWFDEVNESFTTQDCSACSTYENGVYKPVRSGPKGLKDLGIREWTCHCCGAHHDRDTNAAKNIFARGHARLAGGIPVLTA